MSELKPCPFCGGEARYGTEKESSANGGITLRHQIFCGNCFALCDSRQNKDKAIAAWNTRAALSQPSVGVDELVSIIELITMAIPTPDDEAKDIAQAILAHYNVTVKG